MIGYIHGLDARFGWWDDREAALVKARNYANKSLKLDPKNADGHGTSSLVFWLTGHFDEAVTDARKAVQLAPGSADVALLAGFILASSGYPDEAVRLSEKAISLSPKYPSVFFGGLGNAYRLSGQIEKAITAFIAYNAHSPGFGLSDLVIAYHQIGQPEEARRAAQSLLAVRPEFTISAWLKTQFRRDAERLDADVAALRAAGLPMD
jgi:adenylate cyclase